MASDGWGDNQSAAWGGKTGPNPTDRGKRGTKRSLLTDGHGIPLAITVAGAHRHDMKLVAATLEQQVIEPPAPTPAAPQHMALDKGYDYAEVREVLEWLGDTPHIRQRGEEATAKREIPGYRARRWVVERTHSWMNRFRRVLIRREKKGTHDEAFLHFACALIIGRASGLFG